MMKLPYYFILLLIHTVVYGQDKFEDVNVNLFTGIVIEHDESLNTAIQGNPYGIIIAYAKKNISEDKWLQFYNYPEFGFSYLYQDSNSTIFGKMHALLVHYNFYLNDRNTKHKFLFRTAIGLGYVTNPYNETSNPNNFAIASHFTGSSYVLFNYQRNFLKGKLGINTGLTLVHFSNASFTNPNLGINTLAYNVGINYNLNKKPFLFEKKTYDDKNKFPISYSMLLRVGLNESVHINSGQFPFYVGTFQAKKKINFKSSLTTGIDFFKTDFLNKYLQEEKELETTVKDNTNYKTNRVGVFVGHELYVHRFSMVSQVGYNLYYPNKYISRVYERFGFNTKLSEHLIAELTLKINLFRAEGLEFGIGYTF